MSSSSFQSPIPRQSIGTTFVVAISVLGLVALVQLLAVVVHYLPMVRQQVAEASVQTQPTPPPAESQAAPAPAQNALSPADAQKTQKLFADADRNFRLGDLESALKSSDQLAGILPGDPRVLWMRAQILEKLEQPAEAVLALEEVLKNPALPPESREMASRKLEQLSKMLGATPRAQESAEEGQAMPENAGEDVRDPVGLQPGANLGITDVRITDGKPGMKNLRVAIKSRPGSVITTKDLQIRIYFYEETEDGEVVLTDSKVNSQWLSPPVDWAENEPELVEVQYVLPDSNLPGSVSANGAPGRKYFGYVVGVYYAGELQDFRSEPGKLARQFPLPLSLPRSGE